MASEQCPEEWGQGTLVLLYKDGDKRDPYNYRGITLLSVVSKAFAALVNSRLMEFGDTGARLAEEQAGFRAGRSCLEQVFVLREVLGMRKQRKTYACFIDIKKAYDTVWRDGLWAALWQRGVRGKMWRVIRVLWAHPEARSRQW